MRTAKGFTFLEVLAAMVILSVAGVALMTVSSQVFNQLSRTKIHSERLLLVDQIRNLVANEQSCRLLMGGPESYMNSYLQMINGPTNQVMDPANPTAIVLYEPVTGLGRPKWVDQNDSNLNKFGDWTVTSLTLEPLNPPAAANSVVPSKITIRETAIDGQEIVVDDIYLSVAVDAAYNILSCYPLTYSTDGNYAAPCPSSYFPTTTGPNVRCVRLKCDPGFSPIGLDASGNVICN